MAKTSCRFERSKTPIKIEECEDESEIKQPLHRTNDATKSKNKITKNRSPARAKNLTIKLEDVDDRKILLALPNKVFTGSGLWTSKIANLIGYIINDRLDIKATSKKAKMCLKTAKKYYQEYLDDPEHKISLPKTGYKTSSSSTSVVTQQKINDLIHYITNERMNLSRASDKIDLSRSTARSYYARYLGDSKNKNPTPETN